MPWSLASLNHSEKDSSALLITLSSSVRLGLQLSSSAFLSNPANDLTFLPVDKYSSTALIALLTSCCVLDEISFFSAALSLTPKSDNFASSSLLIF